MGKPLINYFGMQRSKHTMGANPWCEA